MKRAVSCFSLIFITTFLFLKGQVYAQIRSPYAWPESTPEEQGLDTDIVENAFRIAEKMAHVDSLLIVRNGFLIGERYYHGYDKYTPHLIASASKSFISAFVGILLREKYIHSLDQKMLEFFPEYITPNMDPRKRNITIRQLLQMRSGFSDQDYDTVSSSWIRYAIEHLPLRLNPGEGWLYSSFGTHLLSAIITRASGMSTREFAEKYLFQPLNISVHNWNVDPQGYYTGGWGMYLTPRDMARFGYLYLNQGKVNDTLIIPEDFVKTSWQFSEAPGGYWTTSGIIEDAGYGYLWWMGKMGGLQTYGATGYSGQHIIVIPALNMVVVMTSNYQTSSYTAYYQHRANFMLETFNLILPIRDTQKSPPHAPMGVEGVMIENRSLIFNEYMNVLTWQTNHHNQGVNISGYRIYLYVSPLKRYQVAEMNAGARMFWHWRQGIEKQWEYVYGVISVTAEGQESLPAMVVVKWPEEQGK